MSVKETTKTQELKIVHHNDGYNAIERDLKPLLDDGWEILTLMSRPIEGSRSTGYGSPGQTYFSVVTRWGWK